MQPQQVDALYTLTTPKLIRNKIYDIVKNSSSSKKGGCINIIKYKYKKLEKDKKVQQQNKKNVIKYN